MQNTDACFSQFELQAVYQSSLLFKIRFLFKRKPETLNTTSEVIIMGQIILILYIYGLYLVWVEFSPILSVMFLFHLLLSVGNVISISKMINDFSNSLHNLKK